MGRRARWSAVLLEYGSDGGPLMSSAGQMISDERYVAVGHLDNSVL